MNTDTIKITTDSKRIAEYVAMRKASGVACAGVIAVLEYKGFKTSLFEWCGIQAEPFGKYHTFSTEGEWITANCTHEESLLAFARALQSGFISLAALADVEHNRLKLIAFSKNGGINSNVPTPFFTVAHSLNELRAMRRENAELAERLSIFEDTRAFGAALADVAQKTLARRRTRCAAYLKKYRHLIDIA